MMMSILLERKRRERENIETIFKLISNIQILKVERENRSQIASSITHYHTLSTPATLYYSWLSEHVIQYVNSILLDRWIPQTGVSLSRATLPATHRPQLLYLLGTVCFHFQGPS